jgi:hypothetical protein
MVLAKLRVKLIELKAMMKTKPIRTKVAKLLGPSEKKKVMLEAADKARKSYELKQHCKNVYKALDKQSKRWFHYDGAESVFYTKDTDKNQFAEDLIEARKGCRALDPTYSDKLSSTYPVSYPKEGWKTTYVGKVNGIQVLISLTFVAETEADFPPGILSEGCKIEIEVEAITSRSIVCPR